MNAKQQAFLTAYLVCMNATEAAKKAGYRQPRSQGQRLLTNVDIKSAIAQAQNRAAKKADLTRDDIIEEQKRNLADARRQGDITNAIKATAELSKLIGAYAPEKVLHGHVDFTYLQALEAAKQLRGAE